ncbi:MAG: carbon storage regulator CsrA [Peptococcaceae bacterium]|nr:carbon storage regulator CsrA [Peptococcaceae bacterium]
MLVISRKIGESIMLGDDIEIKIAEVSGERVKLAIDAPREVLVLRKELHETNLLNQQANQHLAMDKMSQLAQVLQQHKIK